MYANSQFKKRQKQQARKNRISKKANVRRNLSKASKLLLYLAEAINTYFPSLKEQINSIPDDRKQPYYSMADVVFSVIAMFLLKASSRNNFNEMKKRNQFAKAFTAIFKYKMPHMDTAHGVIEKIDTEHLEAVSLALVKILLKRKTLSSLRILSDYHVVSVDGVKVATFYESMEGTTKKESKNGVKTYLRSCLQARIVTANGFAIPIMTEWIASEDGERKEDCELNAFKRLAPRLKEYFPRLSMCLVGDALYANDTVFSICSSYGWKFIVTLKDKLKTVHAKISDGKAKVLSSSSELLPPDPDDGGAMSDHIPIYNAKTSCVETLCRELEWLNAVPYKEHSLTWIACSESTREENEVKDRVKFAWLSNIKASQKNVRAIEKAVRQGRSCIEDAFNTGKNRGYAMKHKFARKSFNAAKNYLACLHIAEAINQLVTFSTWFHTHMLDTAKATLKAIWFDIVVELRTFNIKNLPILLKQAPRTFCYQ